MKFLVPPKPEANIIDTTPAQPKKETTIKPSKTQETRSQENPSKKLEISSLIQVPSNVPIISSHVEIKAESEIQPVKKSSIVNVVKPSIISKVEIVTGPPVISSKIEIITSSKELKLEEEPVAVLGGNNLGEPEYDFLSRQPSEVVEETYKVFPNVKPSKPSTKFILRHKPSTGDVKKAPTKRVDTAHPTGLVTKLGGTVIKDGTTTIHETSVIGTYISGKYAQVTLYGSISQVFQ